MVLPVETRLTPTEAAELVGLSRPFLVRLLDEGRIPSQHLPGSTHRQIRLADVLKFQAERERKEEALQRIASIVEDEDLPY